MDDYYDRSFDDPLMGYDPQMAGYGSGIAAPAAVPEMPVSYEKDIAPGARRLFDEIGSDPKLGVRGRIMLQRELLNDVGDLAVRQGQIEQLREESALRRMRTEKYSMDLNIERNRRAQAQSNQERMGVLEQELQGVLKLPEDQRKQRLAEIEVNNFGLLNSSPWAGSRFKSVREALAPQSEIRPFFSSQKELMDFTAEHADNPEAVLAALSGDPIKAGAAIKARALEEKKAKTAEEKAKDAMAVRDSLFDQVAKEPFMLDSDPEFEVRGNTQVEVRKYVKPETQERIKNTILLFGTDEQKKEWEEVDSSPDRDRLRVKIANEVRLQNQLRKLQSQQQGKASISENLVRDR